MRVIWKVEESPFHIKVHQTAIEFREGPLFQIDSYPVNMHDNNRKHFGKNNG